VVDLLTTIAGHKDATPAQVALAWLLAQGPNIVSIPGTTKVQRLEENTAAASVELTSDELDELNTVSSLIDTSSVPRYPETMQRWPEHKDQSRLRPILHPLESTLVIAECLLQPPCATVRGDSRIDDERRVGLPR